MAKTGYDYQIVRDVDCYHWARARRWTHSFWGGLSFSDWFTLSDDRGSRDYAERLINQHKRTHF